MNDREVMIEAFNELAPRYEQVVDSELQMFFGWGYEEFIDRMLETVQIKENDLVLDVATGTLVIPRKLIDQFNTNFKLIGLDITAAMLMSGKKYLSQNENYQSIRSVCASAMEMPYKENRFDTILCALATHHMEVPTVLKEMNRILKSNGKVTFADVVASRLWRFPGVNWLLKIFAYLYFLKKENRNRAWAEAAGVSNLFTVNEWKKLLVNSGFKNITVTRLKSNRKWLPDPIIINAYNGGE